MSRWWVWPCITFAILLQSGRSRWSWPHGCEVRRCNGRARHSHLHVGIEAKRCLETRCESIHRLERWEPTESSKELLRFHHRHGLSSPWCRRNDQSTWLWRHYLHVRMLATVAAHRIVFTVYRVGAPPKPLEINAMALLSKRPVVTGSMIGGMKETQEMLDFCDKHNITSDIENIPATPDSIKTAFDRTLKSDVKYRFVLDMLHAFKWIYRLHSLSGFLILINLAENPLAEIATLNSLFDSELDLTNTSRRLFVMMRFQRYRYFLLRYQKLPWKLFTGA